MPTIATPATLVFAAYTGLLAVLSLAPSEELPDAPFWFEHMDKVAHFGAYLVYGLITLRTVPGTRHGRSARAMVVLYCTAFGVLMEFLQGRLTGGDRMFSPADMAANAAGSLFGVLVPAPLPWPRPANPAPGEMP